MVHLLVYYLVLRSASIYCIVMNIVLYIDLYPICTVMNIVCAIPMCLGLSRSGASLDVYRMESTVGLCEPLA